MRIFQELFNIGAILAGLEPLIANQKKCSFSQVIIVTIRSKPERGPSEPLSKMTSTMYVIHRKQMKSTGYLITF